MRYAAVGAAWISVLALLVWQAQHHGVDALLWGAFAASLAAGAAIGSWWATLLPLAGAVVTYLLALLGLFDCRDNCEFGRIGHVLVLLFLAVPIATAAMAAGVTARKIARYLLAGDRGTEA